MPPVTMKMRTIRYIELDQIKSDADIKSLLSELQQPNVSIYLFWPNGPAINPLLGDCIRRKQFEKLIVEGYWYKDPNSDHDFIHIERNPELDFQKEIQETQPMLCRAELKLPKRGRLAIILDRRKNQALFDGEAQPKTEPTPAQTEKSHVKGKARRGPAPGTVDRYGKYDRALFPEVERIMSEGDKSPYAACCELAENGKVKGVGTAESRAKRLASRFKKERSPPTTR
jgi:hypothetical protein